MPKITPKNSDNKVTQNALSRWDGEGGAGVQGPQKNDDGFEDHPAENTTNLKGADIKKSIENKVTTDKPVWFITGCSTGFGHALAKYVLDRGYRAVVTSRKLKDIGTFAVYDNALLLPLDVTDAKDIKSAMKAVKDRFGQIDVLVNNAGIGYFAAIEEGEDDQIHKIFDINVFGLLSVTRAALPHMRKRKSGFIINISSIGGLRASSGVGYYNATKFAVEGLSEALWQEVEPLGIKVMLVEPSGFRTDWAGRSAKESKDQIDDYAQTAGKTRNSIKDALGHQAGDPIRAVEAIVKAYESKKPPHRLLLGNNAYDGAISKLDDLRENFVAWESVTRGADHANSSGVQ